MRSILVAACAALSASVANAQEAPQLEYAFTITAEIAEAVELGETTRGPRRFIPITGGSVDGQIEGKVRAGAWDWQLDRPDGCTELEADYFIEADDGALINVINNATICPPAQDAAPAPVFTQPNFEPPLGKYQWLGSGVFVGQLSMAQDHPVPAVQIRIYRVR